MPCYKETLQYMPPLTHWPLGNFNDILDPGGGALPLWESVGMPRGFAPHFRHLDDLIAPQNVTLSSILFRSCWVSFQSPPFSACRRSFCPSNWPNLSFYSDLVGSYFELRAAHPYCFWPRVPPRDFRWVIFMLILVIDDWSMYISCEIAIRWM